MVDELTFHCKFIKNISAVIYLTRMISLSHSLLEAKIHVPPLRQGLISRKRLLEQLDLSVENRLTLISAPAGYGKTTLLCEWTANRGLDVKFAWLALDEEDNDPTIYLQYIVAALQVVDAEIGQNILSALQAPTSPNPAGLLLPLLNQLNQRKTKIVLVLDDYHLITEQAVHRITRQFIEQRATGLHVVLATRADPPLPVHRYRARGELTELRQAQLSFTIDEAREFLTQTVGDFIQPEEVVSLHQRTEGWVVGLLLAGLSLRESGKISESVAAFSGNQNYIMEFLVNEVLDCQNERIRDFLLKTSILDRLTGSLCDRLTCSEDGYATLEWLKSKNLFISAVDDEQVWYRYHQLFADLLRRRLKRDNMDALPRLHKSASNWYAQNGFLIEAIDHAILSEDFVHVVSLIEKHADKIWSRGEQSRLLMQLQSVPIQVIHASVPICLLYSILLVFRDQHQLAKELLLTAEELIQGNTDLFASHREQVLGTKALYEAQLALLDLDLDRVISHAQQALVHLPEDWQTLRQMTRMILADASNWQGDTITAGHLYSELLGTNTLQQNPYVFFITGIRNALLNLMCGRLHTVYEYCLQCAKQIDGLKPCLFHQFEWILNLVSIEILTEWNQLDELRNRLESTFEKIKGAERSSWDILYLNIVRGYMALGDIASARYILNLLEDGIRSSQLPRPYLSDVLAWKVRVLLWEGNALFAEEVLAELSHLDFTKPTYPDEEAYLSMVRLWISQGKFQESTMLLEALQAKTRDGGRIARLIKVYILRALTEEKQEKSRAAREYLEYATVLAESEGFIRTFIEEGSVISHLLKELVLLGNKSVYVHQLIEAFDSTPESSRIYQIQSGSTEPFSERERQVLHLLKTHLSQQEMADQLNVSVNTIRFHIKNIYSKLDVHDRSDAVRKAKEIGLR